MYDSIRYRREELWERPFLASRVAPWAQWVWGGEKSERRPGVRILARRAGRSRGPRAGTRPPADSGFGRAGKSAVPAARLPSAGPAAALSSPDSLRAGLHNRKLARVCFVLQGSLRDAAEGWGPGLPGRDGRQPLARWVRGRVASAPGHAPRSPPRSRGPRASDPGRGPG